MKHIRILLCFMISLFFIGNSHAETLNSGQKPALRLDQVIEKALTANHKIFISDIEVRASQEAKKEAVTEFLPKLKTGYGFKYRSEPEWVALEGRRYIVSTQDTYRWTTSVVQTIFKGLATLTNFQIAELELKMAEIRKAATRLDIILEAKKRYFAVQNAKLLVEVGDQTVKSLNEHLSVAREYYNVGLSPKIDVLNAEVDLSDAEQGFEKAKNNVIVAKADLNNIMDISVDSPIEVAGTLEHVPFTTPYEVCSQNALKLRPGLEEAKNRIKIAEKQIRLVASDYFPHVTASVNYNRGGDHLDVDGSEFTDRENWNAMATATWTFFEFGKTRHASLQAKEGLKKAEKQMRIVEDRISFEVKKAYHYLMTAHHNIKVAEKGVESAKENLEISTERYKEQVATITEVLDAQTRLTQARTSLTNVLNEYNVSMAALYWAMGME